MNQLVGNCPKCGAPIWAVPSPMGGTAAPSGIPQTVFTCECRNKVELQPKLPVFVPYYVPAPQVQPLLPWDWNPWQPYIVWSGDVVPASSDATKLPFSSSGQTISFPNIHIGGPACSGGTGSTVYKSPVGSGG